MPARFLENPFLIAVLILVIIVVFGANKLPGAAKALGQSLRIFKNEVRGDDPQDAPQTADETRHRPSDKAPSGDDLTG